MRLPDFVEQNLPAVVRSCRLSEASVQNDDSRIQQNG